MGRKKKHERDLFASKANSSTVDYFGTMYDSMCKDKIYKSLHVATRQFYVLCRVQARSKSGRNCLFNHCQGYEYQYDPEEYFVFPAKHQEEYGVKRQNGKEYLKELVSKGFIEVVENNKHRRKVNVYKFSTKWKDVDKNSL